MPQIPGRSLARGTIDHAINNQARIFSRNDDDDDDDDTRTSKSTHAWSRWIKFIKRISREIPFDPESPISYWSRSVSLNILTCGMNYTSYFHDWGALCVPFHFNRLTLIVRNYYSSNNRSTSPGIIMRNWFLWNIMNDMKCAKVLLLGDFNISGIYEYNRYLRYIQCEIECNACRVKVEIFIFR